MSASVLGNCPDSINVRQTTCASTTKRAALQMMNIIGRSTIVLLASAHLSGCTPPPSTPDSVMHLEEIGALLVPDSFPVTRVVAGPNNAVTLMSSTWPFVLERVGESFEEVAINGVTKPIGISYDNAGSIDGMVDAGGNKIVTLRDNRIVAGQNLDPDLNLTYALATLDGGWIISAVDESGRIVVLQIGADRGDSARTIVADDAGDAALVVSLSPTEFAILNPTMPEMWSVIREGSSVSTVTIFNPADPQFSAKEDDVLDPYWAAVGAINVENHILFTVADLRSHKRELMMLDPSLNVIRQTRIDAPIGFVATVPDRSQIVAVRKLSRQEIVTYHWVWGAVATTSS